VKLHLIAVILLTAFPVTSQAAFWDCLFRKVDRGIAEEVAQAPQAAPIPDWIRQSSPKLRALLSEVHQGLSTPQRVRLQALFESQQSRLEKEGKTLQAENELAFVRALESSIKTDRVKDFDLYFSLYADSALRSNTNRATLEKWMVQLADQAKNPYSILNLISERPLHASIELYRIASDSGNSLGALDRKLNTWVNSPERALHLYDQAEWFGSRWTHVFSRLRSQNKFFRDVLVSGAQPDIALTYSFEKETRNPKITEYYQDPVYDESVWLALSPAQRQAQLSYIRKKFMYTHSANEIAPTARHPKYLGGYSEEMTTPGEVPIWEVTSSRYLIDRNQLKFQMKDLSTQLGETTGFHAHIVFELPVTYAHFDRFRIWYKQASDFIYLKGMEEGLHSSQFLRILNFTPMGQGGVMGGISDLRASMTSASGKYDFIPTRVQDVTFDNVKYSSLGLRAELYGESRVPGHRRLGLELRDPTRSLDIWSQLIDRISNGLSGRRWEKLTSQLMEQQFYLRTKYAFDSDLLINQGISHIAQAELLASDVMIGLPLVQFEKMQFYDYQAQKIHQLSAEDAALVATARARYIDEIQKIGRNIDSMRAKGDEVDKELIQAGVRMTLTEWAKQVKPSRFYPEF
jgi:hypothetical protein